MKAKRVGLLCLLLLGGWPLCLSAEVVIIVGLDSPVKTLTPEQVTRIFLRKKSGLPDGLVLEPVDQPKGALRDTFYQDFIGMNRPRINAYWAQRVFTGAAQPPLQPTPEQDAQALVANSRHRIGYAERTQLASQVRIVSINP